ncbi:MAG: DUF3089 domain-containing protein [Rhodothalassiaceae bacterium]
MPAAGRVTRIFLYIIAAIVVAMVALVVIYMAFEEEIQRFAIAPSPVFEDAPLPEKPDYADPAAWAVLPDQPGNAGFLPPEVPVGEPLDVAIFYIHPSGYRGKAYWNAPIDEPSAVKTLANFYLPNQANVFYGLGDIYAPRYRQASVGAFFEPPEDLLKALYVAYADIQPAFQAFLERIGDKPFIIAGHSQGALHALFLLRDTIAGTPLAERLIAAYILGWPVTVEADIAPMQGIQACRQEADTGCIISWQSFASDGAHEDYAEFCLSNPSLYGTSRKSAQLLCTNPLTWRVGDEAPAPRNSGTLPMTVTGTPDRAPIPDRVGAACSEAGILLLDPAPTDGFTTFLLPGKNYHVYDYNLFWSDLRANARTRAEAWLAAR